MAKPSKIRTKLLETKSAMEAGVVQRRRELHHYEDHTAFFFGKVSAASASLITYFLTLETLLLVASLGLMLVMMLDVWNIRVHKQLLEGKSKKYKQWAASYVVLSTGFMFIMGMWCFLCFSLTENFFVHLRHECTTLVYCSRGIMKRVVVV